MTIEIRPAAVRNQISEKERLLGKMLDSIDSARSAIAAFCDAGGAFSGDGYAAAQSHFAEYLKYLNTLELCITRVIGVDGRISGALGVFGDMSVVSEQEWLDAQQSAQHSAAECWKQATYYQWNYIQYGYSEAYDGCISDARKFESDASYAGKMLSDIYSYCRQTDNAHDGDDLPSLCDAVAAGSAAFAKSCSYDIGTHTWGAIDSSWYSDEVNAIIAEDYYLQLSCGNCQPVAISDPVTNAISDWWAENGTDITNRLKVGFAFAGMIFGAVMIASGVGAPAGVAVEAAVLGGLGFKYSFLDLLDGYNGLANGENYDWRTEFSRGVAETFGVNPDIVEAGVDAVGLASLAGSVLGLPRIIGKAADAIGSLISLSKVNTASRSVSYGIDAAGSAAKFESGLATGDTVLRQQAVSYTLEAIGETGDSLTLLGEVSNDFPATERGGVKYVAYENVAVGYGY